MFLYEEFEIQKPQLIISVTGGAKNFTLPEKTKIAFKKGLIKAAANTNALIITGGTYTGVMKLVGEAYNEAIIDLSNVSVLGIASWARVADAETLVVSENRNQNKRFLSHNLYLVI